MTVESALAHAMTVESALAHRFPASEPAVRQVDGPSYPGCMQPTYAGDLDPEAQSACVTDPGRRVELGVGIVEVQVRVAVHQHAPT